MCSAEGVCVKTVSLLVILNFEFLKVHTRTTEDLVLMHCFYCCLFRLKVLLDSDITGILVLFRNFRISSRFTAACKNSASAECVSSSMSNHVWKDYDVFWKPITS